MGKTKILIINGPNLNLLGAREVEIYGADTLAEIQAYTEQKLDQANCDLDWYQSNVEGEIVNRIQQGKDSSYDLLVINPAGYTHTSVAIYDALKILDIPIIEVHLSNTCAREEFRRKKITSGAASSVLEGLGKDSYFLAIYSYIHNKETK